MPSSAPGGRPSSSLGRPKRSSRETLQEAAYELFLERGYPAVSIEEIARRAGVSRSTFWAYASAKSDLLWLDVDAALDALELGLAAVPRGDAGAIGHAVAEVAALFGPGDVPLPMVDGAAMKVVDELQASAYPRLARLVGMLEAAVVGGRTSGSDSASQSGDASARRLAWAEAARIVAACEEWVTSRPRPLLAELLESGSTRTE